MATTQLEPDVSDGALLGQYLGGASPDSFAALVRRHASFVYSVAMRQTRDRHLADDITQNVFILLVKKAGTLREHGELSGWLFNATMFEARNLLKTRAREARRVDAHGREKAIQGDTTMQAEPWAEVEPHLNDALENLEEGERQAVMMRYLRHSSYEQVGGVLGISPAAARQRVHRGLDRMRGFLKKKGVVVGSIGILAEAMRLNGVQAAPAELVASTMKATGEISAGLAGTGAAVVLGSLKAKLVAALLILGSAGVVTAVVLIARGRSGAQTVYLDPAPGDGGGSGKARAQQPGTPSGPVVRPAFKVVSAGSHDEAQGTRIVGGFVGYINKGDWLRYNRVDLGPAVGAGGATFTVQVACPEQFAGNMIEVRQDSLDGPVLATLTVKSTGGHVWRPQTVVAGAHGGGVHDLFLRFSGGGWNLDTFHFTPTSRSALGPIDAIGFNEANGVQIRAGVLCEIADGHWARYSGLDFGAGAGAVAITYSCDNTKAGGEISVHLDNAGGAPIARLKVAGTGSSGRFVTRVVPVVPIVGRHDVVIAFSGGAPIAKVSRIEFMREVPNAPASRPATNPVTLPAVPK